MFLLLIYNLEEQTLLKFHGFKKKMEKGEFLTTTIFNITCLRVI